MSSPFKLHKGRPRTSWIRLIKEEMKTIQLSWEEAKQTAIDKKRWNELIDRCVCIHEL
jgi:hypothetical protein